MKNYRKQFRIVDENLGLKFEIQVLINQNIVMIWIAPSMIGDFSKNE
jgi:hypothetical protein